MERRILKQRFLGKIQNSEMYVLAHSDAYARIYVLWEFQSKI